MHAHQRPDELDGDPGYNHQKNAGRDTVEKEFTCGELFLGIGNGIGRCPNQEQEGHTGYHQR